MSINLARGAEIVKSILEVSNIINIKSATLVMSFIDWFVDCFKPLLQNADTLVMHGCVKDWPF